MQKSTIYWIALILLVIGGLNWGLIGFFNWDLVETVFGTMSDTARVIYAIVGLSAIYVIIAALMGDKE